MRLVYAASMSDRHDKDWPLGKHVPFQASLWLAVHSNGVTLEMECGNTNVHFDNRTQQIDIYPDIYMYN